MADATTTAALDAQGRFQSRGAGVDSEYGALESGALLVDRSGRLRMQFSGEAAPTTITGLVTNDVASLAAGDGCYAAALTPKGKIAADLRIFLSKSGLLVDVPPRAAPGWREIVRKYVNPRVTPYRDVSAAISDCGIFGLGAAVIAGRALGVPHETLAALAPYAHVEITVDGELVVIARVPDGGVTGFEWFAPFHIREVLWDRMVVNGATPGALSTFEVARVEAGRPEWGLDMDDSTIPQEANFDELGAISYTKGCYTGQETVARVHFRGHVNRHLRGLRFAPDGRLPLLRATLVDADGKEVGDVRSAVRSPRLGPIALGMVRREVAIGAPVTAHWNATEDDESGEKRGTVVSLPFGAAPA
jgi:folate-binding protein YgfZ